MKVIHLPLLSSDTSLQDAYQAMQWHLKAAVVRTDSARYSLIRAPELYYALAYKSSTFKFQTLGATLGALPDKFPMHQILNRDIKRSGLNVIDPGQTKLEFDQLLDQVNRKYAVLDSRSGLARVVTREEGLADQLNFSPATCFCDNEEYMHPYPPPNKSHGDTCYCTHTIYCY
jgi:hypothetical protein